MGKKRALIGKGGFEEGVEIMEISILIRAVEFEGCGYGW